MSTTQEYGTRKLRIVDPDPAQSTAEGGWALNENFKDLANIPKGNFSATADPTADDDSANTAGNGTFSVGSRWVNTSNGRIFVCVDAATGAAVWTLLTAESVRVSRIGGINVNSLSVPSSSNITLTFDQQEDWDTAEEPGEPGFFDSTTYTTRLTVPTGLAGTYVVTGAFDYEGNTNGIRYYRL